jgi:hypothetical protein
MRLKRVSMTARGGHHMGGGYGPQGVGKRATAASPQRGCKGALSLGTLGTTMAGKRARAVDACGASKGGGTWMGGHGCCNEGQQLCALLGYHTLGQRGQDAAGGLGCTRRQGNNQGQASRAEFGGGGSLDSVTGASTRHSQERWERGGKRWVSSRSPATPTPTPLSHPPQW